MSEVVERTDLQDKVYRLQDLLLSRPTVDLEVQHTYAPGLYIRTLYVPAGIVLTGKIHATEHIFILSKGTMKITTDSDVIEVSAPFQIVSKPGTKRAGFALTDCVCSNVHITEKTDLLELEAELIIPEPCLQVAQKESVCLGQQ